MNKTKATTGNTRKQAGANSGYSWGEESPSKVINY
jgi:hypothetical protein